MNLGGGVEMAKAVAFFVGIDSQCRHQEVAFRADGVPFHRSYVYNGYGIGPAPWRKMKASEYERGDTMDEACARGTFSWGFKNLTGGKRDNLKLRLPDN